ncbi:MAG: hypothetical protein ACK6BC_13715 [Cyanobacteriota bacterium]
MPYFTWSETGLTSYCESLETKDSRFQESAALMRRMAAEGFRLEQTSDGPRIIHADPAVFEAYGFISEEPPERQLTMLP